MSLLDVIGLIIVAGLVAILCRKHEERICRRSPENSDTGKSFDATSACDRVARVRRDYLAVVCVRSRERSRRIRLHAQVCQTIRGRSYFSRTTATGSSSAATETEQSPG